jgi:hypothetical protein
MCPPAQRHVNNVLVNFPKAPDSVLSEIFNSKCVHLYGCEAWDLLDPSVDKFYKTWNRSVRRLYDLPFTTHTRFLPEFAQRPLVETQVFKRFCKMFGTMLHSNNSNVSFLTRMMVEDARSIIGKNIRVISKMFNVKLACVKTGQQYSNFKCKLNKEDTQTVMMVKELREALRGNTILSGFNQDDIKELITLLCTE